MLHAVKNKAHVYYCIKVMCGIVMEVVDSCSDTITKLVLLLSFLNWSTIEILLQLGLCLCQSCKGNSFFWSFLHQGRQEVYCLFVFKVFSYKFVSYPKPQKVLCHWVAYLKYSAWIESWNVLLISFIYLQRINTPILTGLTGGILWTSISFYTFTTFSILIPKMFDILSLNFVYLLRLMSDWIVQKDLFN